MTDSWQPIDCSIGKATRDLFLGHEFGLQGWLERSAAYRRQWTTNTVNAQLRRLMAMQFLGKAWSHIHENYQKMIRNAWEKTGCLLTADGTDDDLVKPEGIGRYAVPALPAD